MLKRKQTRSNCTVFMPAAFRRLCVETFYFGMGKFECVPAAFRRLCVETTKSSIDDKSIFQPPLGGCVLKHQPAVAEA